MSDEDTMYNKPNYIPFPDEITRDLKECSANEIVVLSFILTKTLKYRKLADVIALSQIDEGVSISKRSISRAIESLRQSKRLNVIYLCPDCKEPSVEVMACKTPYKDKERTTYLYKCRKCGCRETPNIQYSLTYGADVKAMYCENLNMDSNGKGLHGGHARETSPPCHPDTRVMPERDGGHATLAYTRNRSQETILKKPKEGDTPASSPIPHDDIEALQDAVQKSYRTPLQPSYGGCRRLLEYNEDREFWGLKGLGYVLMVLEDMPPELKSGKPINSLWRACKMFPEWHKGEPTPDYLLDGFEDTQQDIDFRECKRQLTLFGSWKKNGTYDEKLAAGALRICIAHGETYGEALEKFLGVKISQMQSELEKISTEKGRSNDG